MSNNTHDMADPRKIFNKSLELIKNVNAIKIDMKNTNLEDVNLREMKIKVHEQDYPLWFFPGILYVADDWFGYNSHFDESITAYVFPACARLMLPIFQAAEGHLSVTNMKNAHFKMQDKRVEEKRKKLRDKINQKKSERLRQ